MAEVEIELWTEQNEPDYARIISNLDDTEARDLYQHLWDHAIDWTKEFESERELFKRVTGRQVEIAEVLQWYEDEGFLQQSTRDGQLVLIPTEPVQESLRGEADSQVVLLED